MCGVYFGKHTMISGIINCKNLDAINIAMLMRTYEYVMFIYETTEFVASHAQSTSTTHFSYTSKCRRTSLRKTYHRVFDFVKSKSTG